VARRRKLFRSRSGAKRLTDWISGSQGPDPENPIGATPVQFVVINTQDLDDHDDRFTVVRIVGEVYFRCRIPAIDFWQTISWGIYKTTSNTAGTIIALSPSSLTDEDSEDWMFLRTVPLINHSGAQGIGAVTSNNYASAHFDIRVQRKLEGLQQIVLAAVVSANFAGAVEPVVIVQHLRSLVKLA